MNVSLLFFAIILQVSCKIFQNKTQNNIIIYKIIIIWQYYMNIVINKLLIKALR